MSRIVNLSHYDLDGVVSHINVKHLMPKAKIELKCGGYGKIEKMISELETTDNVIITDLSLDVNLFHQLKDRVGEKYLWFDHHESSREVLALTDPKKTFFDTKKAGCELVLDRIVEPSKALQVLTTASGAFDLWKKETDAFQVGYYLNVLFWQYNFWNFADKFCDGFTGFDAEDKVVIEKDRQEKAVAFEETIFETVNYSGYKCQVSVPSNDIITADVSLVYGDEFDIMFIITKRDTLNISVRGGDTKNFKYDGYDFTKVASQLETHPQVISAGGHPNAIGITCKIDTTMVDVDVILQAFCYELLSQIDIPF